MQTRKVGLADASTLFSILQQLQIQAGTTPIGPHWSLEQMQEECASGLGLALVDSTGPGEVIAAFVLWRDMGAAREITFLGTAPAAQRQGLMRGLLAQFMQSDLGPETIWLEVHEHNQPARALYEHLGFKEGGKRLRYYRDGGNAILYSFGP